MTLDQMRLELAKAEQKGSDLGCATRLFRKLLAVVEAAQGFVAFEPEQWRNDSDRGDALEALTDALAALEAPQ